MVLEELLGPKTINIIPVYFGVNESAGYLEPEP